MTHAWLIQLHRVLPERTCWKSSNAIRSPLGPRPLRSSTASPISWAAGWKSTPSARSANSGLTFGGNKLRQLEYIVPDAIVSNADTLVSIGGVQSNHTRMVAAVAANQKGFFPEGSRVLYAHLGGGPAINGYSYTFLNG